MSDWSIPFDIQTEIMKRLPVKPLIRFRSVSKPWKSLIDSPKLIKSYGARYTQPNSSILIYRDKYYHDFLHDYIRGRAKFIHFVDDDNDALSLVSPLAERSTSYANVVGESHGLVCLYGSCEYNNLLVIWNPSIRKSFGIVVSHKETHTSYVPLVFGFGVCPVTRDPTVVKLIYLKDDMLSRVEVFTLSSGVWNVIPSGNWARKSIILNRSNNVVIDRFIYWGAFGDDGKRTRNCMVVSFDLITKEFRVLNLPKSITNKLIQYYGPVPVSVCKLRESLVVYGFIRGKQSFCCGVWLMEHDSSFTNLFTVSAYIDRIVGFRKSGEPICEAAVDDGAVYTLDVYDPCSKQTKNLGIHGVHGSFFLGSYKESLLLLDHSDLQIYPEENYDKDDD